MKDLTGQSKSHDFEYGDEVVLFHSLRFDPFQ